jgi:hypothetical protein
MPLPNVSDVHVDQLLTNIAQVYLMGPSAFVAERVSPTVPVKKLTDRILQFDRADFFRDDARPRAPGTESQGGGFRIDTDETYNCQEWAWHYDLPDELRDNADQPIDLERSGTRWVTQILQIRRDRTWALRHFAAGLWTTQYTGVPGAPAPGQVRQWDDYVNSNPIADVENAKDAMHTLTGFEALESMGKIRMVIGRPVWRWLKHHPVIVNRYVFSQPVPVLTEPMVASALGVDELIVGKAVYTNTAEGGTPVVYQGILGRHALLMYVPDGPSLDTPSASYTFNYTGGNRMGQRLLMERYRSPLDSKFDRLVGSMFYDQRLLEPDLGVFIQTVVA